MLVDKLKTYYHRHLLLLKTKLMTKDSLKIKTIDD